MEKLLGSNGPVIFIEGVAPLSYIMDTREILVTSLEAAAQAAQIAGGMIPGVGGTIVRIAGVAFASAAAFAHAGKDTEAEIRRIHDADPLLQKVREGWLAAIKEKFGKKTSEPTTVDKKFEVPQAPDTQVGIGVEDIYEDE